MKCEKCSGLGLTIEAAMNAQAKLCECQRDCKVCKGARYIVIREGIYDVAHTCECGHALARVRRYNAAEIPAHYAHKSLSPRHFKPRTPSIDAAAAAVSRYAPEQGQAMPKRGLVLMGGYGLGKTHMVCGLAARLTLRHGIPVRFVDYQGLLAKIRATFNKERGEAGESEASLITPLVEAPILIIDDLGRGQGTAWEVSIFDQILSRRYNAEAPVLITTNYLAEPLAKGAESLEGRIGERLVSRLRASCELIHMVGEDYRTTEGAA